MVTKVDDGECKLTCSSVVLITYNLPRFVSQFCNEVSEINVVARRGPEAVLGTSYASLAHMVVGFVNVPIRALEICLTIKMVYCCVETTGLRNVAGVASHVTVWSAALH